MVDEARTLWCGNLSDKVSEELLFELFLQVAPLERVRIPTDKEGRKSSYAFITLKHEVSVDYVVQLLDGTSLFDQRINLKPRIPTQNHTRNDSPIQPTIDQQNMMNNFNALFLMGQMMHSNPNHNLQHIYNGANNEQYNRHKDDKRFNQHHNHRSDDHYNNRSGKKRRSYKDRTGRRRYTNY